MVSRLNFHPATDTTPITNVLGVPMALVVNNALPVQSFAEFIAHVRARPGQLSYASAGIGASSHMTMVLLLHRAGLDMVHVPYPGSALAFPDIMAGRVAGMTDAITTAPGFIREGRLRGLAVSTRQRLAVLPDLPSASETLPGYETVNWYGLSGPAALPAPILGALHGAMQTLPRPACLPGAPDQPGHAAPAHGHGGVRRLHHARPGAMGGTGAGDRHPGGLTCGHCPN